MSHTPKKKKIIYTIAALLLFAVLAIGINIYLKLFRPNVNTEESSYLYIRTGSSFLELTRNISEHQLLKNEASFIWVAEQLKYPAKVKPGKYKLRKGMNNLQIVRMLRSGNQEPVKLSFRDIRLKSQFAGYISRSLEIDSASFLEKLSDDEYLKKYELNAEQVYTMFIPNTYEFFWNTTEDKFMDRMFSEYQKFWTEKRLAEAKAIDLSKAQVSILASIVDQEALVDAEMPRIAGVYMNRLKKGMKLEADPTVIFANGDFSVQRVINKLLMKDSPYNTYRYGGLPPGPIAMPSIAAIDAVLHYEHHNYIYFCAREDFSGYHNFATTFAEHKLNARKFQRALNERNIRK
jgi:UPF0755 protein